MKSIILCKFPNKIARVYSEETLERLEKHAGLDRKVYSIDDVRVSNGKFNDTQYIFSTWDMLQLTSEEIKKYFPALKCVFYAAGTVQYFARPFLENGIKVFSAWAANAVPVAEYTVAQIILANKGFFSGSRLMKTNGHGSAHEVTSKFPGNYGATVGIIGAGMIGKLVIKMLKNYNLNVLVFDPFLSDEKAKELNVEKCSLEDLFVRSQVVSNHLANNEQTKGMLGFSLFSKMRPNSTFLNTGRGAQVVESDLCEVLKQRPDITAILDVTFPEPPEDGHEFYKLENCILTPHIAGSSGTEVHRMAEYMADEFDRFISGKPCLYEVTEKMLETMA